MHYLRNSINMPEKRTIRIGLLGFGVVGQGVWKNIEKNRLALEYRLGTQLEITQVVVKDASKARGSRAYWILLRRSCKGA